MRRKNFGVERSFVTHRSPNLKSKAKTSQNFLKCWCPLLPDATLHCSPWGHEGGREWGREKTQGEVKTNKELKIVRHQIVQVHHSLSQRLSHFTESQGALRIHEIAHKAAPKVLAAGIQGEAGPQHGHLRNLCCPGHQWGKEGWPGHHVPACATVLSASFDLQEMGRRECAQVCVCQLH